ncbi:hypothetical protein Sru01_45410 [Sphaerisporangium rufum]|uniref:DUF1440 domain-containing protein n=1 Tax=Sphaerisporangium rufum TaxID=1381558 RepID=A0A919V1B2_9ACTN|nr:DUF6789 family protein [Sphaerisporangium rufum]GII79559.1 hypothetical protein Sru01_45410 [Sphaerisporangium rufum]
MLRNLVNGVAGGVLATAAMSAVMLAGDRAGLLGEHPPKLIARAFLPGSRRRPKRGEGALGAVAHFGFGAGTGALFGVLAAGRRPPVPLGVAYGLAIWLVSYQGWVPGLRIMPPVHRDREDRQAVMAAGHVVYGTTLALALARMSRAARD